MYIKYKIRGVQQQLPQKDPKPTILSAVVINFCFSNGHHIGLLHFYNLHKKAY